MSLSMPPAVLILFLTTSIPVFGDGWSDSMTSAGNALQAGNYRLAKERFEQAIAAADRFDESDLRRWETKLALAEAMLALGDYDQSEQLCNESIGVVEQLAGEKHLLIARAEKALAEIYLRLGIATLANQHCKRGMQICEAIQGRQHLDLTDFQTLMTQVWNLNSDTGDTADKIKTLDTLVRTVGISPDRLIARYEALAGDYYENRWNPDYAERAVSLAESTYGKQHPVYGRCLLTLATALRHTGKFDKSESLSREAIQLISKTLGPDHPLLSTAYRNLASVERNRGRYEQAEALYLDSIRLQFVKLSDAALCRFFHAIPKPEQKWLSDDVVLDTFLVGMSLRGGPVIEQFLIREIEDYRINYERAVKDLEPDDRGATDAYERKDSYARNLELITVLRRVQHEPDPLPITIVDRGKQDFEFPDMPQLTATIANSDVHRRVLGFSEGGEDRSGRQTRWRIELHTPGGWGLGVPRQPEGIVLGGGQSIPSTLEPGEGWETTHDTRRFLGTLEPGEYRVRVLYHNRLTIADREFVTGLVVCRSEPFTLTIRKRVIHVSQSEQAELRKLLGRLDNQQLPRVVEGTYGPAAHEFIDPTSDTGRILSLGYLAVPTLIDELERAEKTPRRRAHVLGMLFSITGEIDPRPSMWLRKKGALGTYAVVHIGWGISSRRTGGNSQVQEEPESGTALLASGPFTYESELEPVMQVPLIEQWRKFKTQLQVSVEK